MKCFLRKIITRMTYDELTDVAKKEQNEKARPAYAG